MSIEKVHPDLSIALVYAKVFNIVCNIFKWKIAINSLTLQKIHTYIHSAFRSYQ